MGYDLHITRAESWINSEETPISLDEWREYVNNDPEIKIDPVNNHRDDELIVLWFGEDGIYNELDDRWFCWNEGQIYTKNPDNAAMRNMIQIANTLNAKLQGDEDEEYHANGEIWTLESIDAPPGFFHRLGSWLFKTPPPEQKHGWVMTGRWN